jgi:lysozyme
MPQERKPPSKKVIAGTLISAAAIAVATPLIQRWEGRSLDPYSDIVGVRTVCDGETRVQMRRYTNAECDAMTAKAIRNDFGPKVLACTPGLRDQPNQLAAAISLSYNIGSGNYCRSTVARRFNAGNLRGGCNAFTMWNRAGGRFVQGLANRREAERAVCLKGL